MTEGVIKVAVTEGIIEGFDRNEVTVGMFARNLGQIPDDDCLFYAVSMGTLVRFGPSRVSYTDLDGPGNVPPVTVVYPDSEPVIPRGVDGPAHRMSYFIGSDPEGWVTDVPVYTSIQYRDLWDGIDLRFLSLDGKIKYEFIVTPGKDPSIIGIKYRDVDGLVVDEVDGSLLVRSGNFVMDEQAPYTYQTIDGLQVPVRCSFNVRGDADLSFDVGPYDGRETLVIDPSIIFSANIGRSTDCDVDLDDYGNIYFTAKSRGGMSYDVTPGAYRSNNTDSPSIYVGKLDPSCQRLIYGALVGGTGSDVPHDVRVGPNGTVLVSGSSNSTDFPTTPGAFQRSNNGSNDTFVFKLNHNASSLEFSTLIGGSDSDDSYFSDQNRLDVDEEGAVYLTGQTLSRDFPVTLDAFDRNYNGGVQDAYVLKLDASGSTLHYSTFIGGADYENGEGIRVDADGCVYVIIHTNSASLPTTPGAYKGTNTRWNSECYILKMSADGRSLVYGTYFGGRSIDTLSALVIDEQGCAYIAGQTQAYDFPTTDDAYDRSFNGGTYDCYVTKVDAQGGSLVYSTFLGGSDNDYSCDIALDSLNRVTVVGRTQSTDYPNTEGAMKTGLTGNLDILLTKLSEDGSEVLYSSYVGGDKVEDCHGMAIDDRDCLVIIGTTTSADFPKTGGTYSSSYGRFPGNFLTKLDIDPPTIQFDLGVEAPTTGEGLTLELNVSDNLAVSKVWCELGYPNQTRVDRYELHLLSGNQTSGNWSTVVPFDPYYAGPVYLSLFANDTVSNLATIPGIELDVIDNDPPWLDPLAPGPVSSGDYLVLSVNVTDNTHVDRVHILYWYGNETGRTVNTTLVAADVTDSGNGTYRTPTIMVPEDARGPVHYFFVAVDKAGNWNTTGELVSEVLDRTGPRLLDIIYDDQVVKGWDLNVSLRVEDAFGVEWVEVSLVQADGGRWTSRLEASSTAQGIYVGTIYIPRDFEGVGSLIFRAMDVSGNSNETEGLPVDPINLPPRFEAIPPWEVTEGMETKLDLREYLVDPNDPLERLRIWTTASAVSVEGTYLVALYDEWTEDHQIEVGASDGDDGTAVTIEVTVINTNDPPIVESEPPEMAFVGKRYEYDLQVFDEDPDDSLTFLIDSGPTEVTIDGSGRLSWTPGEDDVGSVMMNISINDGHISVHHVWELLVVQGNRPPSILDVPPGSAEAGIEYRWDVQATDPDGDDLRYVLTEGPAEASMDNVTGTLTWFPKLDHKDRVVTVAFTVEVSDGELVTTLDFSVLLTYPPNRPPEIVGELIDVVLSRRVTIDLTEHMWDPDDSMPELSWYIMGGDVEPVEAWMNGNVLVLDPTGEGSGEVTLVLVLEDDEGLSDSIDLQVQVLASDEDISPWVFVLVIAVLAGVTLLLYIRNKRTGRGT